MKNYAFFDVDGTLVNIKTMFSFQKYYFTKYISKFNLVMRLKYFYFNLRMLYYFFVNKPREYINLKFYESFSGVDPESLRSCAYQWYRELRDKHSDLFIPETLKILQDHLSAGDEVVFVSGSSIEILAPIADELKVNNILATNMEIVRKKYTGKIIFPQTIGSGKQLVIRTFLRNRGVKTGYTFAYGDDYSDIPMLSEVDFPTIITGDFHLEKHADKMNWNKLIINVSNVN